MDFYGSNDPTNSVKALKEHTKLNHFTHEHTAPCKKTETVNISTKE